MFVYYKVVIELNWVDDDCPWVLVRRLRGARSLTGAVLILKCIWPGLPLPGAHWCQTSSEGGRPAEQRRSRTTQTQVGSGPGGQAPAKPAANSQQQGSSRRRADWLAAASCICFHAPSDEIQHLLEAPLCRLRPLTSFLCISLDELSGRPSRHPWRRVVGLSLGCSVPSTPPGTCSRRDGCLGVGLSLGVQCRPAGQLDTDRTWR